MAKIYQVDLRTRRHKAQAKEMIGRACDTIDDVRQQVAGYLVMSWDDTGSAALAFRTGGPVSLGGMSTYVHDKLLTMVRVVEQKL